MAIINNFEIEELTQKTLIIGEEYLILNKLGVGIYLGKVTSTLYFQMTHRFSNLKSFYSHSTINTDPKITNCYEVRRFLQIRSLLNLQRHFENSENIKEIYTLPNRRCFSKFLIKLSNNTPLSKINGSSTFFFIIKKIKDTNPIDSSEKKIALFLSSLLPSVLCELNDLGSIAPTLIDGKPVILTLSKDKVLRSLKKMIKLENNKTHYDSKDILLKNTEITKIGRIIKQCAGSLFSDADIEKFSNTFNAHIMTFSTFTIDVIKGERIIELYKSTSYTSGHGSLQNSCMRYTDIESQTRFYAVHPKCSLVVIMKGEKLRARALLWETDKGKYLDRIFSTTPLEDKMMKKWANEQDIKLIYNDCNKNLFVETDMSNPIFKEATFPYFDSFTYTINGKYLYHAAISIDHTNEIELNALKYGNYSTRRGAYMKDYLDGYPSYSKGKIKVYDVRQSKYITANEEDCVLLPKMQYYLLKEYIKNTSSGPISMTQDEAMIAYNKLITSKTTTKKSAILA